MADDMDRIEIRVEDAVNAFLDEHLHCGELDTGMIDLPDGEARLWIACNGCGARLERQV